jgi:hypothetical protein
MRALRLALKKDPLKAPEGLAQGILAKALENDKSTPAGDEPAQQEPAAGKSALARSTSAKSAKKKR